jgi:hypothetical protein
MNVVSGFWCFNVIVGVGGGLSYMFILNLISTLVRRKWLAISIFVLLLTLASAPYVTGPLFAVARSAVFFGMIAFALARFGVLAASAAVFAGAALVDFPLTTNWSAWYAPSSLLAMCVVTGLALYSLATTLSGRPWWPDKLDAS